MFNFVNKNDRDYPAERYTQNPEEVFGGAPPFSAVKWFRFIFFLIASASVTWYDRDWSVI